MASSAVILNAVSVTNYTTSVNTSSFSAATAHSPIKASTPAGTSSVTAAAGALFRGSCGFFSWLSPRNTTGNTGATHCLKSNPTTPFPLESTDWSTYDFPTEESFSFPSKQRNPFPNEQANLAPSRQAIPYTSAPEPLSEGSEDYSLLSEVVDPDVLDSQFSRNERTMNSSNNRTPPAGGKILRDYLSGLTGAFLNLGRPATTWVHPDYINNQELQYNFANSDSKMRRQCPQNTLTASPRPFAAPAHQGKRFNIQDTGFGPTMGSLFENSLYCGDPQLKDSSRTSGSDIPDWMSASGDPLPYAMWSNAELSSSQTEELLAAQREPKFLAEQNRQYQYYNKLNQQKKQQNQTTDDSCMVDDGWDIVMNEACVPPDEGMLSFAIDVSEHCLFTEESYLAYENVPSEFDESAMVGTHKLFYSESSDNFLQGACLPPQSIGFGNFNSQIRSTNSDSINSKSEDAIRSKAGPPHISKSQLNPNAKEWTGVCCLKSKLNPEAKEWVPKNDRNSPVKTQTKTITATDVESDVVLITINSEGVENERNADKGIVNVPCSTEICRQDSSREFRNSDSDCIKVHERFPQESEFSPSSVERNPNCLVAPLLTISSSLVCESASGKSSSSCVISCPVPEISVKAVESACDTSLLGLDCVDSIRCDSDSSDRTVRKVICEVAAVASVICKVNPEQESKKRKVSDEEKQCRYHSETSESDQDDDSDVESMVCASRCDRDKPPCAKSSEDESSEEEDSEYETEEESEDEDLVTDLLHTPRGWWRSGSESGDDSSEDEDDESVKDDDDLDTETDDDIVFDCSVDDADCTSVKDKKSKRCLNAMQKVNLRWNSQINENVIGRSCYKISFNEVVRVDTVDKNVERSGVEWERYAMEAKRFKENVLQPHGAIICQVLGTEHRGRIYKERFAEDVSMDGDITIENAGQKSLGDGQETVKVITSKKMCDGVHDTCREALSDKSCSCATDMYPNSVIKTICVK